LKVGQCRTLLSRATQDAVADAYMDVGGRAKQDARAEQSAIRHKQQKHIAKGKGKSMLEGVVPPFPTFNSGFDGWIKLHNGK
jgi:hypothetical protein